MFIVMISVPGNLFTGIIFYCYPTLPGVGFNFQEKISHKPFYKTYALCGGFYLELTNWFSRAWILL